MYGNPVVAGLCRRAEEWVHVNSYEAMLKDSPTVKEIPTIRRPAVTALPSSPMSLYELELMADALLTGAKETATLTITPFAWMESFEETRGGSPDQMRKLILRKLEQLEAEALKKHSEVPTDTQLRTATFALEYIPQKFGKKMMCLATEKVVRVAYLKWRYELY